MSPLSPLSPFQPEFLVLQAKAAREAAAAQRAAEELQAKATNSYQLPWTLGNTWQGNGGNGG